MPPKRILQVTSVLNYGGIEIFLLNVMRNLDKSKYIFDFLVINSQTGLLEEEIKSLGGNIYRIPSLKEKGYFNFLKNLKHFFKSHPEYTIIHSHVNAISGPILKCAQKCGIKTRIAHSHTAFPKYSFFEGFVKNHFKRMLKHSATVKLACSEIAGLWLYGKDFKKENIILNGIDFDRFSFSNQKRKKAREELSLNHRFIILNVGRFSPEKNHIFLLSVLSEIIKTKPETMLICVGSGKSKNDFAIRASEMGLLNNILLMETTNSVDNIYSAADVYVSPSLFEGFGVSVAEAQINNLPCIISNSFPKEIAINSNCQFLSLEASPKVWADAIINSKRIHTLQGENTNFQKYNIKHTAEKLCTFFKD